MMGLKDCINSSEELKEYLKKKARNHRYFKFYATLNKIETILKKQELILSDGSKWNDVRDGKNFNQSPVVKNFGICFSFSKSENVAMWMLYGGNQKRGAMLKFPAKELRKLIDKCGIIEAGYLDDNNNFCTLQKLSKEQYEINLIDVIYYGKETDGYTIKRSDERCEIDRIDVIESVGIVKKRYPWSYENECRLIVSVKREMISDDRINSVRMSLEEIELTEDQIVIAPNFEGQSDYAKSALGGDLDWNLCYKCKHN